MTSFPFHPVLRLLRYEVTSGQTMLRSFDAQKLVNAPDIEVIWDVNEIYYYKSLKWLFENIYMSQ